MFRSIRYIIRNLWFYFWFALLTPIFILLTVASRLLGNSFRVGSWCGSTWSALLLFFAGIRVEADLSAIPKGQAVLLVPNHQSQLDIPLMYGLFRDRHVGFVAKESLFHVPFFGPAMYAAGHVPIDRSNPRRGMKAIQEAMDRLSKGINVIIYPEGTRGQAGKDLLPFQIGAAVMALKCGVPVVPILIQGTGEMMPKGIMTFPAGPKTLRIKALPPVDISGYDMKERERFKDDLYTLMNNAYKEMLP